MAKRWYVVHAYSGFEKHVKRSLEERIKLNSMEELFGEILVPTEEVVEVRRGAKVQAERKFFPGYILVNMELTDAAWSVVQSQPRVTGFLGGKGRPVPITNAEAERLIKQMDEGVERPRSTLSFDVGEEVRVIEGPFESFNGVVEEADDEKERLKVSVSIFGRSTPVELEYTQVEKA